MSEERSAGAPAKELNSLHGQIYFTSLPFIGNLHGNSSHQPQTGLGVWKKSGDSGSAQKLFVQPLQHIDGPQSPSVLFWHGHHDQSFRYRRFRPLCQIGRILAVVIEESREQSNRFLIVRCREDVSDPFSHLLFHALARDAGHSVADGTGNAAKEPLGKWHSELPSILHGHRR